VVDNNAAGGVACGHGLSTPTAADASIVYQVIGDGTGDVPFIQGLLSHLDMQWCDPIFFRLNVASRWRPDPAHDDGPTGCEAVSQRHPRAVEGEAQRRHRVGGDPRR
jgi:hypothetical protein